MGPPSRPNDKPTDINELDDVIHGSGVDLKEEEAALLNSYSQSGAGQQRQEIGYGPDHAQSAHPYKIPRDNYYSQNIPGDRNSFYGAGTFNQPAAPDQSTEAIATSDHKKALRRKAAIQAHHLNDPFLLTGSLQRRISNQASSTSVSLPKNGLFHSQSREHVPPTELLVKGPDGNEVLKMIRGEDLLQMEGPYVEILSLLSLAAEQRMRELVEDAATLAKGRRVGSHGVVPSDLAVLAAGIGNAETVAGLPTPSNSAVSPEENPLKRTVISFFVSFCYLPWCRFLCRNEQTTHPIFKQQSKSARYNCRNQPCCPSPSEDLEN